VSELKSQEDVARWLAGKPQDVARVFAMRAALRLIPVLASKFVPHGRELKRAERVAVLAVFRCAAASWAAATYPGNLDSLNSSCISAAVALSNPKASDAERSVEYAAAAAGDLENWAEFALATVNYAVETVSAGGHQSFESFLQAYATDAEVLDQRVSPVVLATSQLWPGQMPDWAFQAWADLEQALLDANEDWEVWTDWYEARLKGGTADQVLEIARAGIPDETWKTSPKPVNAQIKSWLEDREIWHDVMAEKPEPGSSPVEPLRP
jgi:hypothetical protein